jgi:aspartate-semialdehyde dehydrogenase
MKIIVAGATGMVGSVMLKVLEESGLPITEIIPVASEKSQGQQVNFKGKVFKVVSFEKALESGAKVAVFSAGGSVSLQMAPLFRDKGIYVIDNSSAWRMEKGIPLVVPEINANVIQKEDYIIANPNCSTIQMVMVLAPLQKAYGIKRVVVSTYQSVTGTGQKALAQMEAERAGIEPDRVYPHPIDRNCIPQCDTFLDNGYTKEEMKMVNEPRKIMNLPELQITATAVRVPVMGGHSESVNVTFERDFDLSEVRTLLQNTPGVIVQDDPDKKLYPMPLYAHDKNEVFVGRIRRDESAPNSLNLWIVADNLRKGAATNAVQIAEYLYQHNFLN